MLSRSRPNPAGVQQNNGGNTGVSYQHSVGHGRPLTKRSKIDGQQEIQNGARERQTSGTGLIHGIDDDFGAQHHTMPASTWVTHRAKTAEEERFIMRVVMDRAAELIQAVCPVRAVSSTKITQTMYRFDTNDFVHRPDTAVPDYRGFDITHQTTTIQQQSLGIQSHFKSLESDEGAKFVAAYRSQVGRAFVTNILIQIVDMINRNNLEFKVPHSRNRPMAKRLEINAEEFGCVAKGTLAQTINKHIEAMNAVEKPSPSPDMGGVFAGGTRLSPSDFAMLVSTQSVSKIDQMGATGGLINATPSTTAEAPNYQTAKGNISRIAGIGELFALGHLSSNGQDWAPLENLVAIGDYGVWSPKFFSGSGYENFANWGDRTPNDLRIVMQEYERVGSPAVVQLNKILHAAVSTMNHAGWLLWGTSEPANRTEGALRDYTKALYPRFGAAVRRAGDSPTAGFNIGATYARYTGSEDLSADAGHQMLIASLLFDSYAIAQKLNMEADWKKHIAAAGTAFHAAVVSGAANWHLGNDTGVNKEHLLKTAVGIATECKSELAAFVADPTSAPKLADLFRAISEKCHIWPMMPLGILRPHMIFETGSLALIAKGGRAMYFGLAEPLAMRAAFDAKSGIIALAFEFKGSPIPEDMSLTSVVHNAVIHDFIHGCKLDKIGNQADGTAVKAEDEYELDDPKIPQTFAVVFHPDDAPFRNRTAFSITGRYVGEGSDVPLHYAYADAYNAQWGWRESSTQSATPDAPPLNRANTTVHPTTQYVTSFTSKDRNDMARVLTGSGHLAKFFPANGVMGVIRDAQAQTSTNLALTTANLTATFAEHC